MSATSTAVITTTTILEKTLGNIDKVIIDNKAGGGVVPYLPLPELKKKINKNNNLNQNTNNE